MPVCIARRALHAAISDPDQTLRRLAAEQGAELFDALLEQTQIQHHQGWQTLSDPFLPDPLTLRGLIALAPQSSARARALREQLTGLLIAGDDTEHVVGKLDYINRLSGVRRLRVVGCAALTGWEALAGHPALSELVLDRCGLDPDGAAVLARTRIRTLSVHGQHPLAPTLHDWAFLSTIPCLSEAVIADQEGLAQLPPLDAVPLERLHLEGLSALTALPSLPDTLQILHTTALGSALPDGLRSLTLDDFPGSSLEEVDLPSGLLHLGLVRAAALAALPVLPSLESAALIGCASIVDLAPLTAAPSLRWLDLRGCSGVSDISVLSGLPALVAVSIEGSRVKRSALPPALRSVAVSGWVVDLKKRAERVGLPQTTASLSPVLRSALQQIRALLRSGDTAQIQQALELVFSLDEPELYNALLRGCGVMVAADGERPSLRLGGNLMPKGGPRELARMRWAMLRLLARAPVDAPACAFRKTTTTLRLDSPVVDLADLATVFPQLEQLELHRTKTWRHPEALQRLGALRELVLVNCVPPAGLLYPVGLRRLVTSGDRHLTTLEPLSALSSLEALELVQVDALQSLGGLPASVRFLSISRARALADLSALAPCRGLVSLELRGCPSLRDLAGLGGHERLQQLTIEGCRGVHSLAPLRGCVGLERVSLSDLLVLDLDGLQDATGVYEVSVSLPLLRDLDALQRADLLSVSLDGCVQLRSLAGLSGSRGLRALKLEGLPITGCGDLVGLAGLESLQISACAALADVSDLGRLPALRDVELRDCISLQSLSGLSPLRALRLSGVSVDLATAPQTTELFWEGDTEAQLERLPAERVGALVLFRRAVAPEGVPEDLSAKVRWVL